MFPFTASALLCKVVYTGKPLVGSKRTARKSFKMAKKSFIFYVFLVTYQVLLMLFEKFHVIQSSA
jgi:hypothetical protein